MPIYPAYTDYTLRLDSTAKTRGNALVTPVATAFAAYIAAHPEVAPGPAVDLAYVLYGAVTVGLNRWKKPSLWASSYPFGRPDDVPSTTSFSTSVGIGVSSVIVHVDNADVTRAQDIITALGGSPTLAHVLGRACCTGLAYLSGNGNDEGPFT